MAKLKSFFNEAIATLKTTGTISPSSKYLIHDCLKDIDLKSAKILVEFGAGDGCFTQVLADRMAKDSKLYVFEINDAFYQYCKNMFANDNRIVVLNESAFEFDKFIPELALNKADYIISSLPLTLFSKGDTEALISEAADFLSPAGLFIQYQYSFNIKIFKMLKKYFNNVASGFTFRNVPPAIVYKCGL
jgi:phospholipid N-methyltransferase